MARVFTVAVVAKLTDFFVLVDGTDQGAVEDTPPMTDDDLAVLLLLVHILNGSVKFGFLANVRRPL